MKELTRETYLKMTDEERECLRLQSLIDALKDRDSAAVRVYSSAARDPKLEADRKRQEIAMRLRYIKKMNRRIARSNALQRSASPHSGKLRLVRRDPKTGEYTAFIDAEKVAMEKFVDVTTFAVQRTRLWGFEKSAENKKVSGTSVKKSRKTAQNLNSFDSKTRTLKRVRSPESIIITRPDLI